MARHERDNPDARNFGLGSRDMDRAAENALREDMQSFSSIKSYAERFSYFTPHLRESGVRDLRGVERHHVQSYAEHLKQRVSEGTLVASTAQNYLSAVNRVLEIARGDNSLNVAPVRDAGIPKRSNVCTQSKAVTPEQHQSALQSVSDRLGAQMELQRELGLRYEESAKIDARAALAQAERTGTVTISAGTKGGLAREVPIVRNEQIEALRNAAAIQGSHHSMIPREQTYWQYREQSYQEKPEGYNFHGERHDYAQSRYEALTGVPCPVAAGIEHGQAHYQHIADQLSISVSEAREIDTAAREQVSAELGHGRIDVTNNYLG